MYESANVLEEFVNAKPEFRTSSQTDWHAAEQRRDSFFKTLNEEFAERGLQAQLTRSAKGVYPVWVRAEAWIPVDGLSGHATTARKRVALLLQVGVRQYHEHTTVVSVAAHNGKKTLSLGDRPEFNIRDVLHWVEFMLDARRKPANYTPVLDAITTLFLSIIPVARPPHSNRVDRPFRNVFPESLVTWPRTLVALAIISFLVFVGETDSTWPDPATVTLSALSTFGFLVLAVILYLRRRRLISVSDLPDVPPRELVSVDSWQTVVPRLGDRVDLAKARVREKLDSVITNKMTLDTEIYGFQQPQGYEERERFVLSLGQGVAHIHIYKFGSDIYVGWNSYLNWARWSETRAVSSKRVGKWNVEFRGLKESLYVPSQFDLIDLNSLSEVVHRAMTTELQALMRENKIEEEVDFQIIRGDRDQALDRGHFDRTVKDRKPKEKSLRKWVVG